MTDLHEPVTSPTTAPAPRAPDPAAWRAALVRAAVYYVASRLIVLAGAGVAAGAVRPRPTSAFRPIIDVLTSWDARWYLRLVRDGYPADVPPHVTFLQPEARTAFFPLYPLLVRGVDRILPGGDVLAALAVNFVLGALFVYLVGVLTRRLYGERAAGRAMVLASLFPGSFVLSFAYAEATLLVLAAVTLLLLLDRRWLLAGLAAALATASRPNAVGLVLACFLAAVVAIRREREWRALVAPVLAPLGAVAFHTYLWARTSEQRAWFRVQQEAWNEGASYGWTAVRKTFEFVIDPFDSPTSALTGLSVIAIGLLLFALWKAKLPLPMAAYSLVVLGLMLLPATVTARPRFLFTAFPLLIAVAAIWREDREDAWTLLLCFCSAGLLAVVGLYGLGAVIP
jgi:hypothetical protein